MKKSKVIYIAVLSGIFLFASAICFSKEYYQKGDYQIIRSNPDVPLVAGVDVSALAQKYLSDFRLDSVRRYSQLDDVVVYHLYQNNSEKQITFMVGLHPSVREAEESMLDALNHQDFISMKEWPSNEAKIGESAWYYLNGRQSGYKDGVAFIRRNAVFWIYTGPEPEYIGIETLARGVDQDLMNGAPYIKIQDKLSPPVVQSVDLSQSVYRMGERGTLTIQGSDPEGYSIMYGDSWTGFGRSGNQTQIIADNRNWYDKESFFGTHVIQCWVVNENNLFSSIKEVTVTF